MFKKILLVLIALSVVVFFAATVVSQRAPAYLRSSLQRALGKKIKIRDIRYIFPVSFELDGFEIMEGEPFAGERAFSVDEIRMDVSLLSLKKEALVIDKIRVRGADIVIRKKGTHSYHALSEIAPGKTTPASAAPQTSGSSRKKLPLVIHQFDLEGGRFKFIDYDIDADGFVIQLEKIDANIKNISFPATAKRTQIDLKAELAQGRSQRPALVKTRGWISGLSLDANIFAETSGVHLPYFRPYYARVTPATIENGYLDARFDVKVRDKLLSLAVDVAAREFVFGAYEAGEQLFGLKAEQVLSFLKDPAGRLKFQFSADWRIDDPAVEPSHVIRAAIEKSIKTVVFQNLAPLLAQSLLNSSEQGASNASKELDKNIEKVKDFLKF